MAQNPESEKEASQEEEGPGFTASGGPESEGRGAKLETPLLESTAEH